MIMNINISMFLIWFAFMGVALTRKEGSCVTALVHTLCYCLPCLKIEVPLKTRYPVCSGLCLHPLAAPVGSIQWPWEPTILDYLVFSYSLKLVWMASWALLEDLLPPYKRGNLLVTPWLLLCCTNTTTPVDHPSNSFCTPIPTSLSMTCSLFLMNSSMTVMTVLYFPSDTAGGSQDQHHSLFCSNTLLSTTFHDMFGPPTWTKYCILISIIQMKMWLLIISSMFTCFSLLAQMLPSVLDRLTIILLRSRLCVGYI